MNISQRIGVMTDGCFMSGFSSSSILNLCLYIEKDRETGVTPMGG